MAFVNEELMHKKISNKDIYADYGAMADIPIPKDAVKQYGYLTELK